MQAPLICSTYRGPIRRPEVERLIGIKEGCRGGVKAQQKAEGENSPDCKVRICQEPVLEQIDASTCLTGPIHNPPENLWTSLPITPLKFPEDIPESTKPSRLRQTIPAAERRHEARGRKPWERPETSQPQRAKENYRGSASGMLAKAYPITAMAAAFSRSS